MKSALSILAFTLFVLTWNTYAQKACQTPEVSVHSDAEFAFNQYVINFKNTNGHLNTDLKTITVVIHVVYRNTADSLQISMTRVQGQLEATNKELRRLNTNAIRTRPVFLPVAADCNLQVRLATEKPDGSPMNGVLYHHYPQFVSTDLTTVIANTLVDPDRYVNVWVVPNAEGGAATFPWEKTPTNDGFWVGARWFGTTGSNLSDFMNGGTTFTHELAHYLGVYHTFHNSSPYLGRCELAHDGSIGDQCADTPLDWNLPLSAEQCDTGVRFCDTSPDLIAQTENYMYYNQDSCTNMFSNDQRARMRACLDSLRAGLVSAARLSLEKITIYPNPAQDLITLRYDDLKISSMTIQIYNVLAQKLKEVQSTKAIQELTLNFIPAGVYYLKITVDDTSVTKRIIKR